MDIYMFLAICDDEGSQLTDTKNKCEQALRFLKISSPVMIHTYHSGEEIFNAIKADSRLKYDIVVMDIEFGENAMNGMETTKSLRETGMTAPVIITTSYDTYLREGYGLGIMRYLSKPLKQEDISEALAACIKSIESSGEKEIILKGETEHIISRYREIMYFECCGHTVTAHMNDQKKFKVLKTIGFLEEQFPKKSFFKINKGIIVNMGYVAYIKGGDLTLENGVVLPIAQRRRSECMDFLKKYVKEHL